MSRAAEQCLYSDGSLRKEKTTTSGTTLFTWDEQNMLLATDTSLNLQQRQVDNPGYFGGLSYQDIDGYLNIPLFHSTGTTRLSYWFQGSSFFATANVLDAFGNLLSTPPGEPNPLVFDGRDGCYTDATGRVYMRGRVYNPEDGRFISRDPIGFDGSGPNEYPFVGNNPTGWVDPSGLFFTCIADTKPCNETKPDATPGDRPVPWKLVPDPTGPPRSIRTVTYPKTKESPQRDIYTVFCFIIVDQFCNAYKGDGTVHEGLAKLPDQLPLPVPDSRWSEPMHNGPARTGPLDSPPRFCDWMIGRDGSGVQQCYAVKVTGPDGFETFIQLEPCPFTVRYGPGGATRTSIGSDGKTTVWG